MRAASATSHGLPKILASAGELDVRLATTKKEIRRAQKLRYRVFFEEGGAIPDPTARLIHRDVCRFDRLCDHLIVVDASRTSKDGAPHVVGAYRLLRQEIAEANFGFYSAAEFQVGALIARNPGKRFLELGRSCVAEGYRGKRTLELLWRGIWAYALHHANRRDVRLREFSRHGSARPRPRVQFSARPGGSDRPGGSTRSDAAPRRSPRSEEPPLDPRAIARALPPLIKGYWRLGAKFSHEAVVDAAFGTTDILVVLPIEDIRSRYLAHFAPPDPSLTLAA